MQRIVHFSYLQLELISWTAPILLCVLRVPIMRFHFNRMEYEIGDFLLFIAVMLFSS